MKNSLANTLIFKIILLAACFMTAILYNKSQAAGITPVFTSKIAVCFKHNVATQELKVTIRAEKEGSLQLFLFSPDGVLVSESVVSPEITTTIRNLKRGFYTYECFDKDVRMKSGNLLLK